MSDVKDTFYKKILPTSRYQFDFVRAVVNKKDIVDRVNVLFKDNRNFELNFSDGETGIVHKRMYLPYGWLYIDKDIISTLDKDERLEVSATSYYKDCGILTILTDGLSKQVGDFKVKIVNEGTELFLVVMDDNKIRLRLGLVFNITIIGVNIMEETLILYYDGGVKFYSLKEELKRWE